MIIFGSKLIDNNLRIGKFYCPNCKKEQRYALKNTRKYFHIFFVPIFSTEDIGNSVDCLFCESSYNPEQVLSESDFKNLQSSEENNLGSLELTASDFGKRIGAFIIDSVIIYILISLLYSLKISVFYIIVAFVYFLICDLIMKGSSVGKLILSMKVSNYEENELPSFLILLIRNIIKSICALFPVIFLTALMNEDKQALHDKATNTIVIDKL